MGWMGPKRMRIDARLRGGMQMAILLFSLVFMPPAGWGERIDTGAWFSRMPNPAPIFSSVTRGGELFVAVGEGFVDNGNGTWSPSSQGAIMVSGEGGTWIDLPFAASLPILRAVAFGTVQKGTSLYVVLGGGKTLLTSPDGVTWSQGTLPVDISPRALAYRCTATEAVTGACLSGQFVAVGQSGILTSPDALNWTQRLPATPEQPSTLFQYLNAVTFDGTHFVAVGGAWTGTNDGADAHDNIYHARILTSEDGVSWSDVSPDPGVIAQLYSVAYGNGVWLAVGGHYYSHWYETAILRSTDRINWSSVTPPSTFDKFYAVGYSGSDFVVAKGIGGSSSVYTSVDGQTWTTVPLPVGTGFNGMGFALGLDTLVGVGGGNSSVSVLQSSNGLRTRRGGTRDNPFALFDSDDQPPSRVGLPVYRVNTAALNLVLEGSLFFMKTLGAPVNLRLTFNAYPDALPGMFGRGWWFGYEAGLTNTQVTARLVTGSGKPLLYTAPVNLATASPENPVILVPPVGIFDQLSCYGDYWIFKEKKTRRTYRFTRGTADDTAYLTAITDKNGNAINLAVNLDSGHVTAITDPAGRTITFGYTGELCTRITIPDGRILSFVYDGSSNMTGMTDMNGYSASYVYNGAGFMTRMTVAGRSTSFAYFPRPHAANNDQCLGSVTDPMNGTTTYEFLPNSTSKVKRTSPKGVAANLTALDGNTATVADPLNQIRSITYVAGLPDTFTNANNRKSYFDYDKRGNLITLTEPSPLYKTTFAYDAGDFMIRRTDALSNTWSYAYDSKGNLTGVTSPLGRATLMIYDAQGRLLSVTDAAGNTNSFTGDVYGNMTAMTDALGNTKGFTFDVHGLRCTRVTDAQGRVKTVEYDGNDRLTRVNYLLATGGTLSEIMTYDAFGQTSAADEGGNTTLFERNMLGFITRLTDPMGGVSLYEYDANNNLLRSTDPLSRATGFAYDNADRLTGDTDALGNTLTRSYDAEGSLTSLTNRRGKTTTYTYESAGLLKTIRYPSSVSSISYTRDALGRVTRITNNRGSQVNFTYDKDGRLVEKKYGAVSQATYGYDAVGNLTSVTDSGGTTSYAYNTRNEATGITYPGGKQIAFGYDASGDLARVVYPDGTTVDYTYDLLNRVRLPRALRGTANSDIKAKPEKSNRVTSAVWGGGSVALTYDTVGNLIREIRGNGAGTDYTYDGGGRGTAIAHQQAKTEFARMAFTYDAAGNCTALSTKGIPAAPLPTAVPTATYNDRDQVVVWGARTYAYDGDGNLTGIDNNELAAIYDEENHLTSLTRGGVTVTYGYDGNGNRVSTVTAAKTVKYHHDRNGRLLFETDANGMLTVNYIYAGGRLVALGSLSGGYRYFHYDRSGTTIALTDAAGNIMARYGYTAYGGKVVQGDDSGNPITFVGAHGVLDEGNGLYLMKKRFYDATVGRFLQRDPAGYDGGINLYAYAGGNPVNNIDPQGTSWGGLFSGLASAAVYTVALSNPVGWATVGIAAAGYAAYETASFAASGVKNLVNYRSLRNKASQIQNTNLDDKDIGDAALEMEELNESKKSLATETKALAAETAEWSMDAISP